MTRKWAARGAAGLVLACGAAYGWLRVAPLSPHELQTPLNSGAEIAYRPLPGGLDLPDLARHPREDRRRRIVAGTLMQAGLDRMAVGELRKALAAAPQDLALHAALGEALVLADKGRVGPEAKSEFDLVLASSPNDLVARYYMAYWLLQNGKPKPALVKWVGLMRTVGNDGVWYDRLWEAMPGAAEQVGVDRIALKALCTAGM